MSNEKNNHNNWHSRGYIPHFDSASVPQLLTFRLIDSFPRNLLVLWEEELKALSPRCADVELRQRIEDYLDKGIGANWFSSPELSMLMQNALLFFDGDRYELHSWVVMPNHVHVLLTPHPERDLAKVVHSLKSYTANKANKIIGRSGAFWQREYFDRFIRDEQHFEAAIRYIENNPVKAGLCEDPGEWAFSSASCKYAVPGRDVAKKAV